MAWLLLFVIAVIYSVFGVIFDSKKEKKIEEMNIKKKEEKIRVNISVKYANRYMATMFITAWLILSFIIWRWIL